jgi:hypothetical protein
MSIVFSLVCNLVSAKVMYPLILSNVVLLFFIDLAKAFDTVDHSILVGQLTSIGVTAGSLAWFANYHSQRVQCINLEDLLSQPLPVTKCLILRSTLCSIYINIQMIQSNTQLAPP